MRAMILAAAVAGPLAATAADPDLPAVRDRQAAVQADTDQLARRVGTMLRVLQHYKLDAAGEKKVLEEAAGTLANLSQGEMAAVLAKLDAAAQAADADAAQKHVEDAYTGHRDTLRKLKALLGRYDAIRDLDTAILRLEKLSRDALEMSFRVGDILQDSLDTASSDPDRKKRVLKADFPSNRARREAEEQRDHSREFETLLRQIERLKPDLRADHLERLARAEQLWKARDLARRMDELEDRIRPEGTTDNRHRSWQAAAESSWLNAGALQASATALRQQRDKLQTLRDARHRLAGVIDQLAVESRATTEFFAGPAPEPVGKQARGGMFFMRMIADNPFVSKVRQLADDCGRLAHSARGIEAMTARHAAGPAAGVGRGAQSLHFAEIALRQFAPLYASAYRNMADAQLRAALAELDALIATAEKERSDPLEAANAAVKQIDEMIRDQKKLLDDTARHDKSDNAEAARKQAPQQQRLAERARDTAEAPMPTTPRTRELVKEAAESMKDAGKDLADKQPKAAMEDQKQALAKLEEARKELADAAEQIAQRRDDIAKLDDAARKLNELVKEQRDVAANAAKAAGLEPPSDDPLAPTKPKPDAKATPADPAPKPTGDTPKAANDPANPAPKPDVAQRPNPPMPADAAQPDPAAKPQSRDVARQQEKVTPPTRDLAKNLEEAAPDVMKELDKAARRMEAAKENLNKELPQDGAEKADLAAKDLARAERMIKEELANLRAEELLDQAKLMPKDIDPIQAARELSKAMQQTDDAQKSSEMAQKNPASQDLAKKQEQLARQAEQKGRQKAAEPASNAAKDLAKGELKQAVAEQQKALAEMAKDAAKGDPALNELARNQEALLEAARQLAQSQESTAMALEALKQAMANSPEALKPQLDKAARNLEQAGQELQKADPQKANQAQGQAKDALNQLMQTLEQAAAMAEQMQPPQQPGQPQPQPGEQPGQQPNQPTPAPERNETPGDGDRKPDSAVKTAKAQLTNADGDGTFLNLPARQRELIKQSLTEKLPPEYASFIQQYFVNVAKGKPAAKPAAEPARKE